jgi:hypothetical protein
VEALKILLTNTCRAKYVYLAMDGVVPYGKIVQQRYRRFRINKEQGEFDRHQISPETPYMKELSAVLKAMFPTIVFSDTSEPGEGEHKLLLWLKSLPPDERRSICVYGLDADLILLCLAKKELSNQHSFTLLRENKNFDNKAPGYSTLSIWKLAEQLELPVDEYVRLCILCFGNDFMPNLGLFSLREGGHERALQYYREAGSPALSTSEGRARFLKVSSCHESPVLRERVNKRNRIGERAVMPRDAYLFSERYKLHVLDGVIDVRPVVDAYWKSYHWVERYFLSNGVPDWAWVYPYPDAPLIAWMVGVEEPVPQWNEKQMYTATTQLQFILPSVSLRKTKKRVLFPDEFYDEETDMRLAWMKRYTWESDPRISLPWHPTEQETSVSVWKSHS